MKPLISVTITADREGVHQLKARLGEEPVTALMNAVSHEGDIFAAKVQAIVDCYNAAAREETVSERPN